MASLCICAVTAATFGPDLTILRSSITTYLNMEMAATEEMLKVCDGRAADAVSLVAENANEITTEGGLNVVAKIALCERGGRLRQAEFLASFQSILMSDRFRPHTKLERNK